jgi:hypothetical protein
MMQLPVTWPPTFTTHAARIFDLVAGVVADT